MYQPEAEDGLAILYAIRYTLYAIRYTLYASRDPAGSGCQVKRLRNTSLKSKPGQTPKFRSADQVTVLANTTNKSVQAKPASTRSSRSYLIDRLATCRDGARRAK